MDWITPIFDRTSTDVSFAHGNRHSSVPLKGARNYTDLNRIATNIRYLISKVRENGFFVPDATCRDDWVIADIPSESEIGAFRNDVAALRATGLVFHDTPGVPELPYTHYQKINDIERILHNINLVILMMKRPIEIGWTLGKAYIGIYGGL